MTEFTITHRIEAPELSAAIVSLADALKGRAVAVPVAPVVTTPPVQEMPVQAAPAPVEAAPQPTAAPAPVQEATPAPAATADPAPAKVYTFEDITAAGSQLLELGKKNQLMELLKGYGVQAVTQLKPEQYADVAKGLKELGANI